MLMGLLGLTIGMGVLAALVTRPFVPAPTVAPLRNTLTGLALAAGGMLVFSLTQDWWTTVEDSEPQTTGGTSPFVLIVVAAGVSSIVLIVAALWGRRNWAPLSLVLTGLLVGIAWLASAPDLWDATGEVTGEAKVGLRLATWSLLLLTITATIGSVTRLAEQRAHRA